MLPANFLTFLRSLKKHPRSTTSDCLNDLHVSLNEILVILVGQPNEVLIGIVDVYPIKPSRPIETRGKGLGSPQIFPKVDLEPIENDSEEQKVARKI